jgi:hypothetical protein
MVQNFLLFLKSATPMIQVRRPTMCAEGDGRVVLCSPPSTVIYLGRMSMR